jgi:hypothetical protein
MNLPYQYNYDATFARTPYAPDRGKFIALRHYIRTFCICYFGRFGRNHRLRYRGWNNW